MRYTITAIIPNFNHEKYLPDAVTSLVLQTRPPDKIIVIDDCSTDNSIEILRELSLQFPSVTVVQNPRNVGVVETLNRGLRMVTTDYVYFGAADDRVLPEFFERAMNILSEFPDAGICFTDPSLLMDETDAVVLNSTKWSKSPTFYSPHELTKVFRGVVLSGHASIIKTKLAIDTGGFDPAMEWFSDWYLNTLIAFKHGLCYIPGPLALMRVLPNSYSSTGQRQKARRSQASAAAVRRILDDDPAIVHLLARAKAVHGFLPSILIHRMRNNGEMSRLTLHLLLASFLHHSRIFAIHTRNAILVHTFKKTPPSIVRGYRMAKKIFRRTRA